MVRHRNDAGGLDKTKFPASFVCFLAADDVPDELARKLRNLRHIKAMRRQGRWWRLEWRDWRMLRKACDKKGLFDRLGIQTYEADVHPVRRFLTEHPDVVIAKPHRAYWDIETDSRQTIADQLAGKARVLCWAVVHEDGRRVAGVLEQDTDEAEVALIEDFWFEVLDVEQLCSWGDYDREVMVERSWALGIPTPTRKWLFLDHLELYKRLNMASSESGDEKQSFALDAVATALLGEGKAPIAANRSWEYWAQGGRTRQALVDYNVRDADVERRIEEATGYIALQQAVCEVTTTLPDSRGANPTNFVEGYLLRLGYLNGQHFKTKYGFEKETKFEGAYVMEPTQLGLLRNIHVCDFASLYPSIIITWNISPDTLRHDIGPDAELPPDHCRAYGTEAVFATDRQGMLPQALDRLMGLRSEWKKKKNDEPPGTPAWKDADRRSSAYKIAANSFYGVMGSPFSRFYEREIAESVTLGGQWLLKETIRAAEDRGYVGVYGDSITGERTVVVRRPDGRTEILPVQELFGLGGPALVGEKEVVTFEGWSALARDSEGCEGWFPLESAVRHQTEKELWRITDKNGQVRVTADHSLMVGGAEVGPAEFVERDLDFDTVRAPAPEPTTIDLWPLLEGYEVRKPYKGRQLVKRFEVRGDWIVWTGWGTPKSKVRRFYPVGSSERRSLLKLLGAFISEGSVTTVDTSCRALMSIAQTDGRGWYDAIAPAFRDVFEGVEPLRIVSENIECLRSGSDMVAHVMGILCGFHGSAGRRIPSFVFDATEDDFLTFWRFMVDGDGSYQPSGAVEYTTTSETLAAGVSYLLDQRGLAHSFNYRPSKTSFSIRTRKTKPRRRRVRHVERERTDGYVYDLTVQGAHTFVDGLGRVLLHNTDSDFIGNVSRQEFAEFVEWCNDTLYPRLLDTRGCSTEWRRIKLSYEKEFSQLVMLGKKRYAGRYAHYEGKEATEDSKPEIKGLEYKRGDTLRLARQFQYETVHDILFREIVDPAHYIERVESWKKRILEGELDLDDITMSKRMSKPPDEYVRKLKKDGTRAGAPAHVELAVRLIEQGRDVRPGDRVPYVVVDGKSPMRVVHPDEFDGTFDRYYLWEQLLFPPTQRLLEAAFPAVTWKQYLKARPRAPRKRKTVAV